MGKTEEPREFAKRFFAADRMALPSGRWIGHAYWCGLVRQFHALCVSISRKENPMPNPEQERKQDLHGLYASAAELMGGEYCFEPREGGGGELHRQTPGSVVFEVIGVAQVLEFMRLCDEVRILTMATGAVKVRWCSTVVAIHGTTFEALCRALVAGSTDAGEGGEGR